ncbi:MAG: hypothetical protein IID36_04610 [Planctomycetes bacterium]|nr:hypothetical protein [Planctomycetota bacterium]
MGQRSIIIGVCAIGSFVGQSALGAQAGEDGETRVVRAGPRYVGKDGEPITRLGAHDARRDPEGPPAGGIMCPGTMTLVSPPTDIVDARQPFPPTGGPLEGFGTFDEPIVIMLEQSGVDIACFSLCESGNGQSDCCFPNGDPGCEDAECEKIVCAEDGFCCSVEWDGACAGTAEELCGDLCAISYEPNFIQTVVDDNNGVFSFTLTHAVTPNESTTLMYADGSTITIISHPGNVAAAPFITASGLLMLIDMLNGVLQPPFGLYSVDVDRSGALNASDVLRVIDLLNGAGAFPKQLGTTLPGLGICGETPTDNNGSCCEPAANPPAVGCNEHLCEEAICSGDPFCCTVNWDQSCAEQAVDNDFCACG